MIHILNNAGGSDKINSIRYEDKPSDKQNAKMKRSTPLITIDWNSIIPDPPSNTSDVTKADLSQVESLSRNVSYEEFDLIMLVDDDTENLFKPYTNKFGLNYPTELIDSVVKNIDTVLLNLKYKFRRARPFQVAPHLGYVISVIQTSTHQTPAYPSGHQGQGAIIAEVLSSLYPEHKTKWHELACLVGKARVMQGVHYPSDNEASMILSRILWENMKENLDDKWTNLIKGYGFST